MSRLVLASLALILAVTSVAFAVARGTPLPAAMVELCSGSGPVMIALDDKGRPSGPAHLCPDGAIFVAEGAAPPAVVRPPSRIAAATAASSALPQGRPHPSARARDPPPAV
ncbi:MAG: hypothetical protein ACK4TB_17845 [Gemmobacter sp.]